MKFRFNPVKILKAKLFGNISRPIFDYSEVVQGKVWACTDLDAFPRPLPRLKGIEGVVIMEDRYPDFFLNFSYYQPWSETTLNRHGPLHEWHSHHDLKELVKDLHEQKIKVSIGFWNFSGWYPTPFVPSPWLRNHPELRRVSNSSDLDPFVELEKEGITFAEYIAHQYRKLNEAFGFDGLMLAEFSGYKTIRSPDAYRDREDTIPHWTELYETIASSVHETGGLLLAYDCMGFSYSEARRHGVDYRELARAGLDYLIFQAYPQAWGEYWLSAYADRFDLDSLAINLKTVKSALHGTDTKVFYSVELGDSVEKWWAEPEKTKRQMEKLDPLADGRFLVWANDLFAGLRHKAF
jgi:hypothetical protein